MHLIKCGSILSDDEIFAPTVPMLTKSVGDQFGLQNIEEGINMENKLAREKKNCLLKNLRNALDKKDWIQRVEDSVLTNANDHLNTIKCILRAYQNHIDLSFKHIPVSAVGLPD